MYFYLLFSFAVPSLRGPKSEPSKGGGRVIHYDILCYHHPASVWNYPFLYSHVQNQQYPKIRQCREGTSVHSKLWWQCASVCELHFVLHSRHRCSPGYMEKNSYMCKMQIPGWGGTSEIATKFSELNFFLILKYIGNDTRPFQSIYLQYFNT